MIMRFNEKAKSYGVIKVMGSSVRLHESASQYSTISVGSEVKDARWAGDAVVVTLAEGKTRRYTSLSEYQTI